MASLGFLSFAGAGSQDELLWQERNGTTSAAGVLQLNYGQGNGTQLVAIKAYSTTAATATVGFSYQGGVALPDASFPEQAPLPPGGVADPTPLGLSLDPGRTLLVNMTGGGNAQAWIVWVLFRRPAGCGC
jgi:hypothetical protein